MDVRCDCTGITGCQITFSCDPRTMSRLAQAFLTIGECMGRTARRVVQRERWKADLPAMRAKSRARHDTICTRIRELNNLQFNDLVKKVNREFNESWDSIAYLASETRNAARRETLRERNDLIMSLHSTGHSAQEIAGQVNLQPGTVRNIVSRLSRATGQTCTVAVEDA